MGDRDLVERKCQGCNKTVHVPADAAEPLCPYCGCKQLEPLVVEQQFESCGGGHK